MAKYHINSKGEPGLCKAEKQCPFGGEDQHFTSAEYARAAYETNQGGAFAKVKALAYPAPKNFKEFTDAILNIIPEVSASKVVKPPKLSETLGNGERNYVGALANQVDAEGKRVFIGQTAASAGLKKLVAEAKKAGEIPKWLEISVNKNGGAWVSSISVKAGYKPEGSRKAKAIPESWIYEPETGDRFRSNKQREAAKRISDYVSALGRSYESSSINGMIDYYNSHNAGHFSWRDKYEDQD